MLRLRFRARVYDKCFAFMLSIVSSVDLFRSACCQAQQLLRGSLVLHRNGQKQGTTLGNACEATPAAISVTVSCSRIRCAASWYPLCAFQLPYSFRVLLLPSPTSRSSARQLLDVEKAMFRTDEMARPEVSYAA